MWLRVLDIETDCMAQNWALIDVNKARSCRWEEAMRDRIQRWQGSALEGKKITSLESPSDGNFTRLSLYKQASLNPTSS